MSTTSDDQLLAALQQRLQTLEEKVSRLETQLAAKGADQSTAKASPAPQAPQAPAQQKQAQAEQAVSGAGKAAEQPTAAAKVDPKPWDEPGPIELFFGRVRDFFVHGNPLNTIGAITMLISASLFFKVAVDNAWIGPSGRIFLGILAGLGLIAFGVRCQRKGLPIAVAAGFLGAGQGIVYLSIYNAQNRYQLINGETAFVLDLLLTAVVLAQALRFNSQLVAVMGLFGGFITPILASTGSNNFAALAVYLLLLNTAVLTISYHRSWSTLKWLSFTFTELYLLGWAGKVDTPPRFDPHYSLTLGWILPFVTVFFIYYMVIPAYRSLAKGEAFKPSDIYLTVANGVANFGIVYVLLSNRHRPYLGLAAALVAAVYLLLSSKIAKLERDEQQRTFKTMLGAGAWYLFAAVPMLVSGHHITIAWSIEAALVAWYAGRARLPLLFHHVHGILLLVGIRLIFWEEIFSNPPLTIDRYIPFADAATLTAVVAAVCGYLVLAQLRAQPAAPIKGSWLWVIAGAVLAASLYRELFRFAHVHVGDVVPWAIRDVFASAVWALLALCIIKLTIQFAGTLPRLVGFLLWLSCLLVLFTLSVIWDSAHHVRYIQHPYSAGSVALMEQAIVGALVGMLLLTAALLRGPAAGSEGQRPRVQGALAVAALLLILVAVRRELAALVFLPPLANLIPTASRSSVFEMGVSCVYSLLSFFLYLRGVSKGRKDLIRAAYALFVLTGIKVYLHDLASAKQIYRALSFFVFGAVLLISEFFKARLLARQAPQGERR